MRIAVFGAGIAGLTVAHELSRLGHQVVVYESTSEVGGFFRSARRPEDQGRPSEYSWHGFGPWYHNVFDLLRQIPSGSASVYESLSRPMDFGIAPDAVVPAARVFDAPAMYRMSLRDRAARFWLILRAALSNRRSEEVYAAQNASEAWAPWMSRQGLETWRATFGPWIGSDWTNVSLHTVARFFLKNLFSGPEHAHVADAHGPAWTHGGGAEWLLLTGPSSEVWFDPWVRELKARGVKFEMGTKLDVISVYPVEDPRSDAYDVTSTTVLSASGHEKLVRADHYVLATTPFAARDVVRRIEALRERIPSLGALTADGPHVQISFRIAFKEKINWPRSMAAIIVGDSPWNITLFAQEQAWSEDTDLGADTKSLWTGTACACTVPGRLYGLPATHSTKQEFHQEVMTQLLECRSLDALLREANDGRALLDFGMHPIEIWHEWSFSRDGIEGAQPKWVNSATTQPHLPDQKTPLPNLFLAGAHTRTSADLWSIEAAVESGRRAAKAIDPRVPVIEQQMPWWVRAAQRVDDALYAAKGPHVIDVALALVCFFAAVAISVAW